MLRALCSIPLMLRAPAVVDGLVAAVLVVVLVVGVVEVVWAWGCV